MADLLLTSDGDLAIANGDFALCSTQAIEDAQVIMARVLTNSPDWYCHPEIGANLEDLKGERSTQALANSGVASIIKTLTRDGYFSSSDLTVVAVPEAGGIQYFIAADEDTDQPVVFNYLAVT